MHKEKITAATQITCQGIHGRSPQKVSTGSNECSYSAFVVGSSMGTSACVTNRPCQYCCRDYQAETKRMASDCKVIMKAKPTPLIPVL